MNIKTFEAVANGDALELRMYGVIGSMWSDSAVTADAVARALKESPNCKTITIKMSSPGGAAFEGMAIRSMLSAHPARVTCEIEGLAASAASVIAMGADCIKMHEGSAMMVHEASTMTGGDIQEHERAIAALTALNDGMASVYAARSGMDKTECLALMAAETWLTPSQAVEKKMADEVVKAKQPSAAPTAFDLTPFHYRNAPQQFAAAATQEFTATAKQPPPLEKKTMSFARIATALGLDSSAEEAAVTGAVAKLQARANAAEAPLAELRSITGAQDVDSMIGAVRGFAEAAKQLPELKAQLAEQTKANEEQERASIVAADAVDPEGRRLTPALIALFATKPVSELKAFVAVAPHVVVMQQSAKKQPAVTSSASVGGGSPASQIVTHEGKSWEQMTPAAKHNLHVDAPEIYAALKANHAERGSPRAQTTTQGASA
jgi:ATP-dependent Clp protease protease subunit